MKKIVSLLLATAVILTSNTLSVHAETKQENLPDSEVVEEFNVFNTDVIETTEEIPDIQTRSHITYKVTKLNRTSEIGAYTGQSVSGEPGVTISLSQMKATSFSASSNVAWNVKKNSVGQLLPNCEAKTVDGELWVRGSSVMQGYYKMPEETKTALKDGWLCTGDLGYVDEERFIYLTGRKKNLIITKNGENVSPEELENKLSSSRLVQEVVVREAKGVIEAEIYPDEEYAKKQGLEREEEVRVELQKLIDEYNQGAPAYKKIYSLIIREKEFEKTASRKIKRY